MTTPKNIIIALLFVLNSPVWGLTYYAKQSGIQPNNEQIQTQKIQALIQKINLAGGGVLVFESGTYITGSLKLCSNLKIVLEPGAVIKASGKLSDYEATTAEKIGDRNRYHFITADHVENVQIEGAGTIDGNGPSFWHADRPSPWDFYKEHEYRPSPMLEFLGVKNLQIQGVKITNSAGWTLHINQCSQVWIQGINIENNILGPNTDGIDINGSDHVRISDCLIRTGDDAIVCKTSKDARACEYIAVTNCIIETNCVALKLGTESFHDFKHISYTNCIVKRSSRVIGIVVLDGGNVDQVQVSNIIGNTNCGWILNRFIHINLDQRTDQSVLGSIQNVYISNMQITSDGRALIAAKPGASIKRIFFDQIKVQMPLLDDPDSIGRLAKNDIHFFKSNPDLRAARSVFAFENVEELSFKQVSISFPTYPIKSDWELLTIGKNWGNPVYTDPKTKASILSGAKKPVFKAFWANHIKNSVVDVHELNDSEGKKPAMMLHDVVESKILD